MDFLILGPLEVRHSAGPLPLGGQKQRSLLALLLLNANHVVSRDRLVDELWGGRPPDTATTALHGHVSQLRKLLEPDRAPGAPGTVLVTREPGYLIALEPGQLDLDRFERLVAASRDQPPAEAAVMLRRALALWRGPALADLADELFLAPRRRVWTSCG
jgi:DNA-binding SARP family transcriptional activator